MIGRANKITLSELKRLLFYDGKSGVFTWRVSVGRAVKGRIAGMIWTTGYHKIKINGKNYFTHRLAWFYFYGSWPDGEIDHINRNKLDNRISNLRIVTRVENQQNQKANSLSKSGIRGVCFNSPWGKWEARIKVGNKYLYLGGFKTLNDAIAARKKAEHIYHTPKASGDKRIMEESHG